MSYRHCFVVSASVAAVCRHAASSERKSSAFFAEPGSAMTVGPLSTLAQPASNNPATSAIGQRLIAVIPRAE